MATVTVRLDDDLQQRLDAATVRSGRSRSQIIRDALNRQLTLEAFEQLRSQVLPFAEARGYLTDEDVFRDLS